MKRKEIKLGQKVVNWKGIFGEMGTVIDIVKTMYGIRYKIELEGGRGIVYDKKKNLQIV